MSKKYLVDLAERVGATYAETFIGLLLLAHTLGLDALKTAAVAAVPAALAVLKGALAKFLGDKNSAGLTK